MPHEGRSLSLWALNLVAIAMLAGCHRYRPRPVAPIGSPMTPANVTAVASGTLIHVQWEDVSDDEISFEVFRLSHNEPWASIATVAANTTEYTDSGLKYDTIYDYRVRAKNDAGDSLLSNTARARTGQSNYGGGGCAVVLGDDLEGPPESGTALPAHLWMWSMPDGREEVVADTPFPAPTQAAVLDGGDAGTAWLLCDRKDTGSECTYDITMRFSPLAPDADGEGAEFCFMLHDMNRGDYVTSGLHSSARTPTKAQLPFTGAFPIEPGMPYRVTVVIDRERKVFDLALEGFWIARDVPVDGVVAGPVRYVHR